MIHSPGTLLSVEAINTLGHFKYLSSFQTARP